MKLTTKEIDPGGNLYAESWYLPAYWDHRLLSLVKRAGDDRVRLFWDKYPTNKEMMSWPDTTPINEIMDFIANLPEKRDMADFMLP
jgi:hypothetical protein